MITSLIRLHKTRSLPITDMLYLTPVQHQEDHITLKYQQQFQILYTTKIVWAYNLPNFVC